MGETAPQKARSSARERHVDAREPAREQHIDGRRARRMRTEQRLLEVVGELLSEGGVAAVFVNAVAARSGVEKVLIYRYFGGLEGLMEAYAARSDFWPSVDEILGQDRALLRCEDKAELLTEVLIRHARALDKRPVTLELLGWECAHRNPLTAALESVREERTLQLMEELSRAGVPLSGELSALGALFGAALNYLAVRGRNLRVFGGMGVGEQRDWELLARTLGGAFRGVLGLDGDVPGGAGATGARGKARRARSTPSP